MTNKLRIKDVDKLLNLFQQMQILLNPDLPEKNKGLWEQCQEIAKHNLVQELKKRESMLTPRSGKIASKIDQKKSNDNFKKIILQRAEKVYCERDFAYAKTVDETRKKEVEVLKEIDHLLLAIKKQLLNFPRIQNSLLAVDWKEYIRKYYPFIDKDTFSYQIREAIDVLESLKLQLERKELQEIETRQEQKASGAEEKTTIKSGVNIENFHGIIGDVQAGNVQTGNYASIQKSTVVEEKQTRIVEKLIKIFGAIIVSVIAAIVTDLLGDFGLIERIRDLLIKLH